MKEYITEKEVALILKTPIKWEKLKRKTVMVTGATSQIGSFTVVALGEIDRRFNLGLNIIAQVRNSVKAEKLFRSMDITIWDNDLLKPTAYSIPVHFIINCSGLASAKNIGENPIETFDSHVLFTRNLLDLAVKCRVEKVLHVSTVEAYGASQKECVSETDNGSLNPLVPRNVYPESKRMAESLLSVYKEAYDINFTVVRLSHTLGHRPDLEDGRAHTEFLRLAINGNPIILKSEGNDVRTYTGICDTFSGMMLALLNGNQSVYNLANSKNAISVRKLALLISDLADGVGVTADSSSEKPSGYLNWKLPLMDCGRLEGLGWKPSESLENLFGKIIQDLRKEKQEI